jgi:hypothetical protein
VVVPGRQTPMPRNARRARGDCQRCPSIAEGAGNAGRWPRPWPACNKKRRRQSPQVQPNRPAFPARWC